LVDYQSPNGNDHRCRQAARSGNVMEFFPLQLYGGAGCSRYSRSGESSFASSTGNGSPHSGTGPRPQSTRSTPPASPEPNISALPKFHRSRNANPNDCNWCRDLANHDLSAAAKGHGSVF
jgi:hypothetical protein